MINIRFRKGVAMNSEEINWSNAIEVIVGSGAKPKSGIVKIITPVYQEGEWTGGWAEITVSPSYGYSEPSHASKRAREIYHSFFACGARVGIFDYGKNLVQFSWEHAEPKEWHPHERQSWKRK